MLFLLDDMLGGLTRLLQFLGYDSVMRNKISEKDFIEKSKNENRIVITTSKKTFQKFSEGKCYLVSNSSRWRQLEEISNVLQLDFESNIFTRCSICNFKIKEIEKEKIVEKVPNKIIEIYDKFYLCEHCDKVYWFGGHCERFVIRVKTLPRRHEDTKSF
jgi:uncharacterized protein with PIN domain